MYTMDYNLILIVLIFFTVYKILNDQDLKTEAYNNSSKILNGTCGSCGSYAYNPHRARGLPGPINLYESYGNVQTDQIVQTNQIIQTNQIPQTNQTVQTNNINQSVQRVTDIQNINTEIQKIKDVLDKLYQTNLNGAYLTHGWFVEFHNIIDHPEGIVLGEGLGKIHSVPSICFRAKESFPFLGSPENPIYFPKADNIGFRAMTVLKIPKTGFYDFRILSDDGLRFYYQKVGANIILNEKNAMSQWIMLIDQWVTQAENWKLSKKIYFDQNELILLRMDYYEMGIFATACIKIRQYMDDQKVQESDPPFENTFCSLLWSEVPLLGVP